MGSKPTRLSALFYGPRRKTDIPKIKLAFFLFLCYNTFAPMPEFRLLFMCSLHINGRGCWSPSQQAYRRLFYAMVYIKHSIGILYHNHGQDATPCTIKIKSVTNLLHFWREVTGKTVNLIQPVWGCNIQAA